ncbi:hypothetical protein BJX99DRAFT_157809 [Aspergillus californicus]
MHFSNILSSALLLPALASLALAETVSLYAYGTGVSGLAVHYTDGNATVSSATDGIVSFTKDNGRLVGTGDYSDVLFYVPGSGATSQAVGFTTEQTSTTERVVDGFVWYGATLLFQNDAGELISQFYVKESGTAGEYDLVWGVSGSEYISVGLRSVAPSS